MRTLEIKDVKAPMGAEILAIRPNAKDGDNYLSIVLARKNEPAEYVTWIYNWESKGFCHGNYNKNLDEAWNDFHTRGFDGVKSGMNMLHELCYQIAQEFDMDCCSDKFMETMQRGAELLKAAGKDPLHDPSKPGGTDAANQRVP